MQSKRGLYRFTRNGEDGARVELSLGRWADLSKDDYDAQQIEPTYWALPEEESWRGSVIAEAGGGGTG